MSTNEQQQKTPIWAVIVMALSLALAACNGADTTEAAPSTGSPGTTAATTTTTFDLTEPTADVPSCSGDCPELLFELDPEELPIASVAGDPSRVKLGFFLSVNARQPQAAGDADATAAQVVDVINTTNQPLEVCNVAVDLEAAAVLSLPPTLLDVQANEPGSFGGHPPEGTENVEQFNYDQDETLTPETRRLFQFGKAFTSANAISAFVVSHIEYYAEGSDSPVGASGLSFPPNSYHRAEDYPARNSVLLATPYSSTGQLPSGFGNLLAHELGHMLLNRGEHPIGLGEGGAFSDEECTLMHRNITDLYGEGQVIDPGRPSD